MFNFIRVFLYVRPAPHKGMNTKEIKDRWTTIERENKLKTIIRCLQKHTSLDE